MLALLPAPPDRKSQAALAMAVAAWKARNFKPDEDEAPPAAAPSGKTDAPETRPG